MSFEEYNHEWYNSAEDEHPIGYVSPGATPESSIASFPPPTSSAGRSPGPSDRVRQLRGQQKLAIDTSTATPPARKARRSLSKKRAHLGAEDDVPSSKRSKARGKKKAITATASASELDPDGSVRDEDLSEDDDVEALNEMSQKDKSVHLLYVHRLYTHTLLQKRTRTHRTRATDKRRADLDLVFKPGRCLRGGEMLEGWWCVVCRYVRIYSNFRFTHLTTVYRKDKHLAHGVGFYKSTCATSTLRAHLSREGGAHYKYYREMCEKHDVPAVLKSPDLKKGGTISAQSDISSFLHIVPPAVAWSKEGLLSYICEWVVLDDQVRKLFNKLYIHTHIS